MGHSSHRIQMYLERPKEPRHWESSVRMRSDSEQVTCWLLGLSSLLRVYLTGYLLPLYSRLCYPICQGSPGVYGASSKLRSGVRSQSAYGRQKENAGQGKTRRPMALAGPLHMCCAIPASPFQAACIENYHEGGSRSRTTSCRNMSVCLSESGHEYIRRGVYMSSVYHSLVTFQPTW